MGPIFLSYDRDDYDRVKVLAQALEADGCALWWDRKIRLGRPFDDEIAQNLAEARCVIVVWTKQSVRSEWVRAEASAGKERGVLLPVRLEADARIPLAFKLRQTADLSDWKPGMPHAGYAALLAHVRDLCGAPGTGAAGKTPQRDEPEEGRHAQVALDATTDVQTDVARESGEPAIVVSGRSLPDRSNKSWISIGALLGLPTLVILVGAVVLSQWHVPTRVEAAFPVCRVQATVQANAAILVRAQSVRTLRFERASRATFYPIQVQTPAARAADSCRTKAIAAGRETVLRGEHLALSIGREQPAAANEGDPQLQAVVLDAPGDVVVEQTDASCLTGSQTADESSSGFRIRLFQPDLVFRVQQTPLFLEADDASVEGAVPASCPPGPIRIAARLAPGKPYLEVEGGPDGVGIGLSPRRGGAAVALFGETGTRFTALEVATQGESGAKIPALAGDGRVTYPGYEGKGEQRVRKQEVVAVTDALGRILYDAQTDRLTLLLSGEVGTLAGRSGRETTDYRLTVLDKLRYGNLAGILFVILTWAVPVIIGVSKLYKELSK